MAITKLYDLVHARSGDKGSGETSGDCGMRRRIQSLAIT